jgi:hypothetical protein
MFHPWPWDDVSLLQCWKMGCQTLIARIHIQKHSSTGVPPHPFTDIRMNMCLCIGRSLRQTKLHNLC